MNPTDPKLLLEKYEPKEVAVISADPQVLAARFSPCGKQLAAASFDGRVRRWELSEAAPKELESLGGHNGWSTALAYAPSGEHLYSADSWGAIQAWPYAAEKPEPRWLVREAHNGWVRDLAVSPDGATLVSCGRDRRCAIWDAAAGKLIREVSHAGEDLFRVRFHPQGKSFFLADMKGRVKQWNVADGKVEREFDATQLFKLDRLQDVGGVRCLAIDDSAKWLAVGGTKVNNGGSVTGVPTLLLFDLASGDLKHTLSYGGTQDVFFTDVAFHEDGFLMFTISGQPGNGSLAFQRWEDKEPFFVSKKMINCHSVARHPDRLRLAVVATNAGSNGNGRRLNKDGEYEGNKSPIHLLKMPEAT